MLKICLDKGFKHVQIEFPDDLPHPEGRRGGRGTSLHLQRHTLRDVTEEELAFIEATRPDVFACLRVHRDAPLGGRTARKLAAASKAAPDHLVRSKRAIRLDEIAKAAAKAAKKASAKSDSAKRKTK